MKLDQQLIKLHQAVVDWSQRKPVWWMEQMTWLLLIASMLRFMTETDGLFNLGCSMLVVGMFFYATRSTFLLEQLRDIMVIRLISVALNVATIFKFGMGGVDASFFFIVVRELAFTSYYYFAACDPPKPREDRRSKLALNT